MDHSPPDDAGARIEILARLLLLEAELANLRDEVRRQRATKQQVNDAVAKLIQRQADATSVEEIEAAGEELRRLMDGAAS